MLNLAIGRGSYYHLQKNINEQSLCLHTLMAPLLLQRVCVLATAITHLKSHAAAISHSFHVKRSVSLCCHSEEG